MIVWRCNKWGGLEESGKIGVVRYSIRVLMSGFRQLLNRWDFLGVGAFSARDDEYECLIGPLLSHLIAGADADEIAAFVRVRVQEHFGLSLTHSDIREFAVTTVAWWNERASG